jgi:hypothetical protein
MRNGSPGAHRKRLQHSEESAAAVDPLVTSFELSQSLLRPRLKLWRRLLMGILTHFLRAAYRARREVLSAGKLSQSAQ